MVQNISLDVFNDDEAEKTFLLSKPSCFIIFGKPGSGKSTLAKKFARFSKSVLVTVPGSIEYAIDIETELGLQAKELLLSGESVSEELSLDILNERLSSAEVQHYGYILEGFPTVVDDNELVDKQLQFVRELSLKPDYIINLRIQDNDVTNRRIDMKVDPVTNKLYPKEFYRDIDIEKIVPALLPIDDRSPIITVEPDLLSDDEATTVDEAEDAEDLFDELDMEPAERESIARRLVYRNDECIETIQAMNKQYRTCVLPKIYDYIGGHNQQRFIELDANLPSRVVFQNLKARLDVSLLNHAMIPIRLQGGDNHEYISEDTELEDMLRSLAASEMIAPGYRWRRSRWGRTCPVSLVDGQNVLGVPEFAVSFLDKMYLLATYEKMVKFLENPRRYLLPPQPSPPCKMIVIGGPLSGKTTLCTSLALRYKSKLINVDHLMVPKIKERKEEVRAELLARIVEMVEARRKQQRLARKQSLGDGEKQTSAEQEKGYEQSGEEQEGEEQEDEEQSGGEIEDEQQADENTGEEQAEKKQTEEESEKEKQLGKEQAEEVETGEEQGDGEQSGEEQITEELNDEVWDDIEVNEDHPMVKKLLEEAENKKSDGTDETEVSTQDYIDCLEEAMVVMNEGTPSLQGWILDGFPHTKDQLTVMIESGIVPDHVIVLLDDSSADESLIARWCKVNGKELKEENNEDKENTEIDENEENDDNDEYNNNKKSKVNHENDGEKGEEEEEEEEDDEGLKVYKASLADFRQNWTTLQPAIDSMNNVEPLVVSCSLSPEEAYHQVTNSVEAAFQYQGWEYTGMDQDEEEEDAADDEGFEDDDDDDDPNKKKPFGETRHYCPIMLSEEQVLMPGLADYGVKYREKVYYLSSMEARDQFLETPEKYLPQTEPLQIPPIRLLLLGPKGSGKTLHGRTLAKKYGVLHISFKDRLQELILHKTMKKIGPEYEFEDTENAEDEDEEEELEARRLNKNDSEDFTEEEEAEDEGENEGDDYDDFEDNIRNNILDGEDLENETLDAIVLPWWKEEPFKSKGFILEGFPRTDNEARYLAANGLFPEGTIALMIEEKDACDRLMPSIYARWKFQRDKRVAKRKKKRDAMLKAREEERARRRAEKVQEQEKAEENRLADRSTEENENDSDDEEDSIDIDEIVELEMLEELGEIEDEEDEEETEEDAMDRINSEIGQKYDDQMLLLETVDEALEEVLIPKFEIDASRKPHIVQYNITKTLKSQVEFRSSLFSHCQVVSQSLARRMLNTGYKKPSRFGRWDPVKLYDGDFLPPYFEKEKLTFPVVYRHHVYFLSTQENKERFVQSPRLFLQQPSPKPLVPIKIAIIGPPKSGKTTLANRYVKEYGLMRLSIGEAVRQVMRTHAHTTLAKKIQEHLVHGLTLPDQLAIQALEICLLDPVCVTRGFVLDGYPITSKQKDLLQDSYIIPYKVINLDVPDKALMRRGIKDRKSPSRTNPIHDSHTILAIKIACYHREVKPIKEFYLNEQKNLVSINGDKSKWWVFNESLDEVQKTIFNIQTYIERIAEGHAARIKYICVTPSEMKARIGEFGEYCPVSLAEQDELVDCSDDKTHDLVAEYRGKHYKFPSEKNLELFLMSPAKYVPPLAPNRLPEEDELPKKRTVTYVKEMFPAKLELQGYCPVTYHHGDLRYEAIVPGEENLVAEYKRKFYSFASEHNLDKFMRSPKKYVSLKLPDKVPPRREPVAVSGLPIIGYMEQTVSTAVIKALTAVGCLKPKYPFLPAKNSALLYVAYHLKAHNPKANDFVRDKYKRKMREFEQQCELISYLSDIMKWKYMEPQDRPIDFDHKLASFSSMQASF